MYSERDINIQKTKVQKLIFRYIPYFLKEMTMHLYHLHSIRKDSYSGINYKNYNNVS